MGDSGHVDVDADYGTFGGSVVGSTGGLAGDRCGTFDERGAEVLGGDGDGALVDEGRQGVQSVLRLSHVQRRIQTLRLRLRV